MNRILVLLISLFLFGCGADDFLSRGEYDPNVDGGPFGKVGQLNPTDFDKYVAPTLTSCVGCHDHKLKFRDYDEILKLVKAGDPDASRLYRKPLGRDGHSTRWNVASTEAQILAKWIRAESFEDKGKVTPPKPGPKPEPEPEPEPGELPSVDDFANNILPSLENDCNMCHSNFAPDYESALNLIKVGVPTKSPLYNTAVGVGHMKVWPPDRPEAQALAKWIRLEKL